MATRVRSPRHSGGRPGLPRPRITGASHRRRERNDQQRTLSLCRAPDGGDGAGFWRTAQLGRRRNAQEHARIIKTVPRFFLNGCWWPGIIRGEENTAMTRFVMAVLAMMFLAC